MKNASDILDSMKTIAVVGLSDDPLRPSYSVAMRLLNKGYNIIPVNPLIKEWNGMKCYPSLETIPADIEIDVVDVFRRNEFIPDVVVDMFNMKRLPKCLWLQQGIRSEFAHAHCDKAGIVFVEDRCLPVELSLHAARKNLRQSPPRYPDGMFYRPA